MNEINQTHEGTYDQVHLPIDGTSKLNKGYAFLDFLHPLFLLDFYYTYNEQKWQHSAKSTKNIKFSYGKKVRNRTALTPVERKKADQLNHIIQKYALDVCLDDFRLKRQ